MFLKRLGWFGYTAWHMIGQSRYAFRSPERIQRDRARRVRKMIQYARQNVPYYREALAQLGLGPDDFRDAEDLAKLPVIRREQVQRDPEYFFSKVQRKDAGLHLHSSGSSGVPLAIHLDPCAIFQIAAYSARFRIIVRRTVGKPFGYRETWIVTSSSVNAALREYWRRFGLVFTGIPAYAQRLSMFDPPEKNVPLLNEFRPDVIYTFGSYLGLLFEMLHASGEAFHRPKMVVFGGDDLPGPARRLIQETYGIPAFSAYNAIEASRLAFECERHTGLHVNQDIYPVRIADAEGRTVPLGERGEVIISNLVSTATVLLNYRLGDIAALLPAPCPCGRSLPLISYPAGRCDDCVYLPSGKVLHSRVALTMFDAEKRVRQFQIVQEALSRFTVKVVATPACDRQELQRHIQIEFAKGLGQDIVVDVRFVDTIERTAGGKHRCLISMLPGRPLPVFESEAGNATSM